MSLFNDMTALSKQHAENSGSYTFEKRKVYNIKLDERDCWYYAKDYIEGKPMLRDEHGGYTFLNPEDLQALNNFRGLPIVDNTIAVLYQSLVTEVDEPEPSPTVSLYNLLDYSPAQLDHIHNVLMLGLAKLDSIKLSKSETYQDATAFARILETVKKEKEQRDSEAWAEKTAKEINETL